MSNKIVRLSQFIVLIISTALLIFFSTVAVQSQNNGRCFSETGHCISGRIQEFWEQNGGASVFGYPLGSQQEEFIDGKRLQVQWFERSRLELHPDNPKPKDVLVGRLGIERLKMLNRNVAISYSIGQKFQKYWENKGIELDGILGTSEEESLALFGKPISEVRSEIIDGKSYTVQWFERARLQCLSENQSCEIILGALGSELFPLMPPTYTPPISEIEEGTSTNLNSEDSQFDLPSFAPIPTIQPILIPNKKPEKPAQAALEIQNNTGDKLQFTLFGPTENTFPLANGQTLKLDINPGTYQSRIAARCDVKTESFTIQAGQVKKIDIPQCVKLRTDKAIIKIINNNNDRARFIFQGPISDEWFVRAGQTIKKEVIAGEYESTFANICGSISKNFTISEGETLEFTFEECGPANIKVVNNNDTDIEISLRGPTFGTWNIPNGQTFEQEILSGEYQITVNTACGSNTEKFTIAKNQELTLTPKCEPSIIKFINKGNGVVRVTLEGPTSDNWSVSKGQTIEKKVPPGNYQITVNDGCKPGKQTKKFAIAAGESQEFIFECVVVKTPQPRLPTATIIVENKTGGKLQLKLTGPRSYNWSIPNGQTGEKKIVPGEYKMNVQAICGSQNVDFSVNDGNPYRTSYVCQTRK